MSHRDFDITEPEVNSDPPVFSLGGREFKCIPNPPGGVVADLFWAAQGNITTRAAGFVRFITGCLAESDEEAFEILIHDKEVIIDLATLSQIGNWLVEEYTNRPTTPFSGSGNGSSPTPVTPGDGAVSAASLSAGSDS